MKSIIEEASSITQAIQNAWERAGKPQEFSIKIFEESEKSFFGMRTLKSAKIGLFFKEDVFLMGIPKKQKSTAKPEKKSRQQHTEKRKQKNSFSKDKKTEQQDRLSKKPASRQPQDYAKTTSSKQDKRKEAAQKQQRPLEKPKQDKRPVWTDEMVNDVQQWMKQSLSLMAMPNINFSANVSRNHLRLKFDTSITGDEKKERMLYSSFANLIMASLRNKFKREFRNLRVVISH